MAQSQGLTAFFEAIERDATTGEVLSIFRTDSRNCELHEAFDSITNMIGANIDEGRTYELRRFNSMPADW